MKTYFLNRSEANNNFGLWQFTPSGNELFKKVSIDFGLGLDSTYQMISIGNYILMWGRKYTSNGVDQYPYVLREFDSNQPNPLEGKVIQSGNWPVTKFYEYVVQYS